jgi:hypothetical protein
MPPIRPPPPTATSKVSISAASASNSSFDSSLAEQGLDLIVGVNAQSAGLLDVSLACSQGIGIAFTFDDQGRSIATKRSILAGDEMLGTKMVAGTPSR